MLNLAVPMSKAAIKVIRMHYGNTGASLFLATDANGTEAVLKLHGVATPMVTAGKMSQLLRLYRGRKYLSHELLLARSLSIMADECGLGHINIKEWVTRVRAVIPVTGEKIDEERAVLAEYARGVSLEMLTLKLSSADLLDALAAGPHAALRDAALFDVLFVQGDRHAENVFLGDDGYFKLIDSRDQALDSGLDSVFFASTISFERNRVGNEHLFNHSKQYVTHHWPQNTLDYRCHVPGGAIGLNYPPKVRPTACVHHTTHVMLKMRRLAVQVVRGEVGRVVAERHRCRVLSARRRRHRGHRHAQRKLQPAQDCCAAAYAGAFAARQRCALEHAPAVCMPDIVLAQASSARWS